MRAIYDYDGVEADELSFKAGRWRARWLKGNGTGWVRAAKLEAVVVWQNET